MKKKKYKINFKYLGFGVVMALIALFCFTKSFTGDTIVELFSNPSKVAKTTLTAVGLATSFLCLISIKNSFERVRK